MKLVDFTHQNDFVFKLVFENGQTTQADLSELLKAHAANIRLDTARIDNDWGCLEFNEGMVDIEPKTLYHYVTAS